MSGTFDDDAHEPPSRSSRRAPSKRPRALLPTLGAVVVLVVLISIFVQVWTGHLWFASLGFSGVYTKVLVSRVVLFFVFGLVFAGVVGGNIYLAHRMRPILFSDGYRNPTMERYQEAIEPYRRWVLIGISVVLFLFAGASGSGHWKTYLMWRNGVPFGQGDVYFHKDIGFYVFGYPWYRYLLDFGFTALVIGIIAAALTQYLYGGIRLRAKHDKISLGANVQLSVLLGLFVLLKAVAYWLDRYGLALDDSGLINGVTYTDAHAVLPSKSVLAIIALICAALFFGNVIRPGWMLPVLGLGLLVLSAILIGGIWPLIVQRFQVKPSEPDKEAPYIQRNIQATRDAYDLNDMTVKRYPGTTDLSAKELKKKSEELPGVRLIDPKLVSPAFENLQQMRGFYTMPDVLDVDRYRMGNQARPQDVVVAPRELNLNGLRTDQRNWNNDHTVYTHGYGVVAAYGDKRGPSGEPVWAEQNLPSVGEFGKFRQQIYFGQHEPDYSIVGAPKGSKPVELNIPRVGGSGSDQYSTYDGGGGVRVGSTFNRLLYSAKFWDSSIFLSGRVNPESKIIYDRDPRKMVKKVAPWLTVDGDPYPAVVDGKLKWVLDGFTTTDNYPMADIVDLSEATSDSLTSEKAVAGHQSDNVNYIRNSVKMTVDAYDGTVTLYQWDTDDPLLKAWMNAFPGVVEPKSAISPQLMAHLRYPEDLFKMQREVLSTYHVTDPKTFYGGSENWKVPQDPTNDSQTLAQQQQPPFYMTVKLPDGSTNFALSTVYVPQSRQNLASFVSVNANATSPDYGKVTVLELPSDNTVPGPGQMQNQLSNDSNVTKKLLPYTRQDASVLKGNLLTLPFGGEMLYAQPVYTRRGGAGSYPILQYVTVSLGNQVGIGRSFDQALNSALGLEQPKSGQNGGTKGGGENKSGGGNKGNGNGSKGNGSKGGNKPGGGGQTTDQKISQYLQNAQTDFRKAQQALDEGELGAYQKANQRGLDWLDKAIAARAAESEGKQPSGNAGTPTSPTGPSSPTSPTAPT
ncbi:MAG: UPF0182 family protein, partial [Nocardioidaceae bacterium]